MKKILFIVDSLEGGGAERVLIDNLNYLKNKCELHLLVFLKQGAFLNSLPSNVKLTHILDTSNLKNKNPFFKLKVRIIFRLMKSFPFLVSKFYKLKEDFDVGISAYEGFSTVILAANTNKFKRSVAYVQNDLSFHNSILNNKILAKAYNIISELIFVSDDSKNSFNNYPPFNQYKGNQYVIYNPVDVEQVIKKSNANITVVKTNFLVVSSGRLVKIKGFDKLITAASELIKIGIQIEVLILGTGPQKETLQNLINGFSIEDNVKLLGFCANPYPYIKAADLFVFLSDYEGYPLVLAEAMVLEKPILATNVTGIKNILNNGEYGFLVNNNKADIYNGMLKLIKDESLRNSYSNYLNEKRNVLPFLNGLEKTSQFLLA